MTALNIQPKLPAYDPKEALGLYLSGRHAELCTKFVSTLEFFRDHTLYFFDPALQPQIDTFVLSFLYIFTQPDFVISKELPFKFVGLNRTISNVVAISSLKNTDSYLELIRSQQGNYVKILTLYSARNSVHFDRKTILDLDGDLGSLWYIQYGSTCFATMVNPTANRNLREHFLFSHPKITFPNDAQELYFGSTYVDGKCDRDVKIMINDRVRTSAARFPAITNRPNPRKIAVFSTAWVQTHSVYRILYGYVKALRPKYHVTFFQLGRYGPQDPSLFDEYHVLDVFKHPTEPAAFLNNDFQIAYFPDIGMCFESIFLANRRIAPIQVCGLGHSVSTWGSDIDYYVTGEDCEIPDVPESNYSERVVLLPGMGAIHNPPLYSPVSTAKRSHRFTINILAFCQKMNYSYVATLKKLLESTPRDVLLRFFVGVSSSKCNDHLAFYRDLAAQLGSNRVEVYAHLTYDNYMSLLQEGDLTIDTFHFGGCNTISDSLFLRLPTVTWEGTKWYNRIGSQMLRLIDLHDCIATNERQYLDICLRLINDDDARAKVRDRIKAADLNKTIYSTEEAKYFTKAMDYLVENHEQIQGDPARRIIRIPRD